jgi:hypothetical protein
LRWRDQPPATIRAPRTARVKVEGSGTAVATEVIVTVPAVRENDPGRVRNA